MIARLFSLALSKWQITLAIIVLLIGSLMIARCNGYEAGVEATEARYAAAREEALRKARESDERASEARQADNERNRTNAQERETAARDGGRNAVNCQRLQAAGYDTTSISACN